ERSALDPASDRVAEVEEALPHGRCARSVVVAHATELHLAVLGDERVAGARVAVEGHADAPRVDELDPSLGGTATELEVGVAEDESLVVHAAQELLLVVGGLREEAADVRRRRAVAVARLVRDVSLRERGELLDHRVAELSAARGDRTLHQLVVRRLPRARGPALAVAADPRRVELSQPVDGLRGPGPEQGVVAPEDEAVPARAIRVRQ